MSSVSSNSCSYLLDCKQHRAQTHKFHLSADISDTERPITTPPPTSSAELDSRQQALNYSTLAAAAAANVPNGGQDSSLSSTETLLRNIQGLLKVAADNARQQERQISFEKGEPATFSPFKRSRCSRQRDPIKSRPWNGREQERIPTENR